MRIDYRWKRIWVDQKKLKKGGIFDLYYDVAISANEIKHLINTKTTLRVISWGIQHLLDQKRPEEIGGLKPKHISRTKLLCLHS